VVAQDRPDRLRDVRRRQHRQRHLIEQRLKRVIVLAVDQVTSTGSFASPSAALIPRQTRRRSPPRRQEPHYSPVITVDNINIDGSIKFQNAAAMVDIFPFHGRFRISGGMTVYNNTYLAATLNVPGGTSFTLGNTKYYSDPNDPIAGAGTFTFGGKTAPRVSIGTGNMLPRKGRWTFEGELGVQFITQPTVVYSISGAGCPASGENTIPPCGAVQTSDIAQEQTNLQNDLMDLRYFPIASIGLGFKIH
jgi:hypothetical protein